MTIAEKKYGIDPGDVWRAILQRGDKHGVDMQKKLEVQINANEGDVNNYDTQSIKSQ